MSTEVATQELSHETLSALVIGGDLSRLSVPQKMEYYTAFCRRIGLDPATQPFKILKLQGKETLYAGRECAAQLCKLHGVSHTIVSRSREDDLSVVIAKASTSDGRCTESMGAVSVLGLKGEALANALMKTETKAKRRATLDLLGLGLLDETEIETIPGAVAAALTTEATVTESKPLQQAAQSDDLILAKTKKYAAECATVEELAKLKAEMKENKITFSPAILMVLTDRYEEINAEFQRNQMDQEAASAAERDGN